MAMQAYGVSDNFVQVFGSRDMRRVETQVTKNIGMVDDAMTQIKNLVEDYGLDGVLKIYMAAFPHNLGAVLEALKSEIGERP